MKEGIKVICESCGHHFDSYTVKLKERNRSDGIIEVYYLCPFCRNEYVVCLHNDETKRLQKAITLADRSGQTEKARKLRLLLKERLDELNKK